MTSITIDPSAVKTAECSIITTFIHISAQHYWTNKYVLSQIEQLMLNHICNERIIFVIIDHKCIFIWISSKNLHYMTLSYELSNPSQFMTFKPYFSYEFIGICCQKGVVIKHLWQTFVIDFMTQSYAFITNYYFSLHLQMKEKHKWKGKCQSKMDEVQMQNARLVIDLK